MAFKMQSSVPELMDPAKEPASVMDLYGCKPGDGSFDYDCLLARRFRVDQPDVNRIYGT